MIRKIKRLRPWLGWNPRVVTGLFLSECTAYSLLVDDEALVRMIGVDILEDAGFHVLEASDAEEALSRIEASPDIAVLFTDVNMPGISGLELARRVHARWPGIAIIVSSGRVLPEGDNIPDDGRFMSKPYKREDLLRTIADLTQSAA